MHVGADTTGSGALGELDPARVGPYAVERRLGAGGMGTVYLARDPQGRPVALKVIHEHLRADRRFRERFAREVAAASRVAGFCTARVLAFDLAGAAPYLVTEYVDGVSLHARVTGSGPLSESDTEALAVGVAAALTAIHAAGVVHLDLTPSNVLLSQLGPKVIDFGIARALDAREAPGASPTATAAAFGTPGWLAPEQVYGQPLGPAADVFAWGLLVAWAGTGRHPFGGERGATVPAPVGRPDLAGLGPRLVPLVARALAADPRHRPTSRDLLLALCGSADTGSVRAAVAPLTGRSPVPARPTAVAPTRADPRRRPAPAPRAIAPRRARRARRSFGRTLVLLVTLGALVVCVLGLLKRTDPAGTAAAGPPQATASTAAPGAHRGAPTPTPRPSTTRDGGLEFTVSGLRCGATELGQWPTRKVAQGRFCLLDLKVTNIGTSNGRVWMGSQKLVDSAGKEYSADDWAWLYYTGARPFVDPLNPGNSVQGTLVYDAPAGTTFTRLVVRDSPLSRGTALTLR